MGTISTVLGRPYFSHTHNEVAICACRHTPQRFCSEANKLKDSEGCTKLKLVIYFPLIIESCLTIATIITGINWTHGLAFQACQLIFIRRYRKFTGPI